MIAMDTTCPHCGHQFVASLTSGKCLVCGGTAIVRVPAPVESLREQVDRAAGRVIELEQALEQIQMHAVTLLDQIHPTNADAQLSIRDILHDIRGTHHA